MGSDSITFLPLTVDPLVEAAYQKALDAQPDVFHLFQVPKSLLRAPAALDDCLSSFRFLALSTLNVNPRNIVLSLGPEKYPGVFNDYPPPTGPLLPKDQP